MKNIIILISSIVIFISGIYIFMGNLQETEEKPKNNNIVAENGGNIEELQVIKEVNKNPLFLDSFSQKEFHGHDFKVGQVLDNNNSYTRYYITYQSDSLSISGIMNVPKGEGPFPVLILNHGYIDPSIYTNGRGLKREQDYLARRGYVVIHPDYRNHAESDKDSNTEMNFRLGYVEDVVNLIEAIQVSDIPYINAERIGMLGHSMGGGIAQTIMVTHPELVDAFVLFAPVSTDARDNFNKWTRSREDIYSRIIDLHGEPSENSEFWDGISPMAYLTRVSAPVMLHHGTKDESVPIEWSEKLVDAMKKENKEINYHVYPGEPHEFATAWSTVMQRSVQFFNQHLR